jgi:hypothetical protein
MKLTIEEADKKIRDGINVYGVSNSCIPSDCLPKKVTMCNKYFYSMLTDDLEEAKEQSKIYIKKRLEDTQKLLDKMTSLTKELLDK